jgi:chromatin assembly factor 1 subunit A
MVFFLSPEENSVPYSPPQNSISPNTKSSPGLTEPGSSPLDRDSPCPNPTPSEITDNVPATTSPIAESVVAQDAFPALAKGAAKTATGEPPKKRRLLTAEEKKAKAEAEEARKKEREAKKAKKDEEKAAKAEEKAAKAAEKAEKERKKREKEEEEAKKQRGQMKLTNMFKMAPAASKKETPTSKAQDHAEAASADGTTGGPKEKSLYEQMFKEFFLKEHVRLAKDPVEMDEETKATKVRILEEYVEGKRNDVPARFDPVEALQIPYVRRRGRIYPSVRKIMEEFHGLSSSRPIGLTIEEQKAQLLHIREALKSIPVKSIKFREDVRPPYIGTISGLPPGVKSLGKLARKPTSRQLPLNYDYDSEAEWQDEDGEDVDDLDDDEEEADMDEDMADFLDDSEDVGPSRMVFSGGMEPESSGLCWENGKHLNSKPEMSKYRMEFILGKSLKGLVPRGSITEYSPESLEHHLCIDPFSTAYWQAPPKSKPGADGEKSSASTSARIGPASTTSTSCPDASGNRSAPLAAPSDALNGLSLGSRGSGSRGKSQQPLAPEIREELKDLVRANPKLSKLGVVELFASTHPKCSKAQLKFHFDSLFEKVGKEFKVRGE